MYDNATFEEVTTARVSTTVTKRYGVSCGLSRMDQSIQYLEWTRIAIALERYLPRTLLINGSITLRRTSTGIWWPKARLMIARVFPP